MNAWTQLLDVQALDSKIQKLDHRHANLADRARLAETQDRLAVVRSHMAAAEAERGALVKEQRAIEDAVGGLEERIAHEEHQLYDGHSSDAGLLQTLQNEIASLKRRILSLEDDELAVMEQIEPIDARLGALASDQAALDTEAIEITAALAEAEAAIAAERDAAQSSRDEIAAVIEPDAVARYEQTRDRLGGLAVATLESGVCGSCHLKLSAVEFDRIQHLRADEEVSCEQCGRFLVRV